ncbi:sugar transferase [Candidatus Fermentibacteria bacterium]|nr:MAG: sugar transferase [Candidatus Fermentibacteria bacterium]
MPRPLEALAAFALIIITLPLTLVTLLISSIFIGFPPFYNSIRTGRYGSEYTHWKIRSMKRGRETGRVFFEAHRINRWGRLLRRLHLDELPELFLILAGRMSFVGPRPLPAFLMRGLDTSIRETVRPGWTGLAQLCLLRKGKLDKRLQIRLDSYYVSRRSTSYDLKILMATLLGVFRSRAMNLDAEGSADRIAFTNSSSPMKPES